MAWGGEGGKKIDRYTDIHTGRSGSDGSIVTTITPKVNGLFGYSRRSPLGHSLSINIYEEEVSLSSL